MVSLRERYAAPELLARCLARVWRAQHFAWWMTEMLHLREGGTALERRLQLAQLAYVTSSTAAAARR